MGFARWIDRRFWWLLIALVALGLFLRGELAAGSPVRTGYWYDPYHEAVERIYNTGRLPQCTDCWQCYQPPLFPLLGVPLYAAGTWAGGGNVENGERWMMALPFLCGSWCVFAGWRILRELGYSRTEQLAGVALLLAFPCLFLSTYGFEGDILLAALLTEFALQLLKYHRDPKPGWKLAISLGVLAGLAAATKYSGLVGGLVGVQVLGLKILLGPNRWRTLLQLGLFVLLAVGVGGWKYFDNWRWHGTPLFANGTANDGFALGKRPVFLDKYEFFSFRLPESIHLSTANAPPGQLYQQPVYDSVWTALHAQCWTDMSVFSEPTRHGSGLPLYPSRGIPDWLSAAVLWLGVIADVFALFGFLLNASKRAHLPLTLLVLNAMAAYFYWVIGQDSWALKTKYLLFLLPPAVAGVLTTARVLRRWLPHWAIWVLFAPLIALVLLCGVYQHRFAVGAG